MYRSGYNYFTSAPGTVEQLNWRVCGTTTDISRNVNGPTSWASAILKHYTLHDSFSCSEEEWHEEAVQLCEEIDETTSSSIKALMIKDLQAIVKKNLGTAFIYESEEEDI